MEEKRAYTQSVRAYFEMLAESGVSELVLPKISQDVLLPAIGPVPGIEPNQTKNGGDRKHALVELRQTVQGCMKCGELCDSRTQTVFGAGHVRAPLVFVGEAPGFEEDRQGLPFVGKAGQLLTKMIEAIGMTRNQVFICNVLKCRPPENRNPKPEEVLNCRPYLWSQLEIIKPKIICALGNFASQALLGTTKSISQLRGSIHEVREFRVICTFHPAYLLRNPDDKRKAWEDLKRVRAEVNSTAA